MLVKEGRRRIRHPMLPTTICQFVEPRSPDRKSERAAFFMKLLMFSTDTSCSACHARASSDSRPLGIPVNCVRFRTQRIFANTTAGLRFKQDVVKPRTKQMELFLQDLCRNRR